MYFLYSALLVSALAVMSPWWLLRMKRSGQGWRVLRERLGSVPENLCGRPGVIWVHAVSVGELIAITPVAQQLAKQFPDKRVVVSTTTATGQKLARERFGENAFYFPLDLTFAVRRYMRALRPELIVVAETEFWPNFLRLAKNNGARIAVVNARVSDRSLPRYRCFRSVLARVLRSVDIFLAQSAEDAVRLIAIGAEGARVHVTGNLKFDVAPPARLPIADELRRATEQGGAGPVIVCGSTVTGEEQLVLNGFKKTILSRFPRALLVLAPRRPERFDEVAAEISALGLPLERRSVWNGNALSGGVFLVDSIGELATLYQLADVAIVGGSLVPHGGHNVLEPAYFGKAIIVGPHTHNFRDIVGLFIRANALRVCSDVDLIRSAVLPLLEDSVERQSMGERARQVVMENAGATARTLSQLGALIGAAPLASAEPHKEALL